MRNYLISKEMIEELKKMYQLVPSDLQQTDFKRGFKPGQLDVVAKLESTYNKQERGIINVKLPND